MITIKNNSYGNDEKRALFVSLQAAVKEFINTYCEPPCRCQACEYRHVCYDLIKIRDYALQQTKEVVEQ